MSASITVQRSRGQIQPLRLERRADVVQRLARFRLDAAIDQRQRPRHVAELAGQEHEAADRRAFAERQ
jgi:hypothetical protein